jgi:tetratricopeptide (TPR) repeat protein
MTTKMTRKFCLIPLLLGLAVTNVRAQDTTTAVPRDQLQRLTAQLQQSPADQALREKVIGLTLTLNPKPTTPDAAIMAEGAAEYAFKNAKTDSDYSDAAKQYDKALLLAPWLAADYFNCGVAHEKAGENKEAIRNFNLYLPAAPNAEDALAVKRRIGGLQYAAQKAQDEANNPAAQLEKFFKSLDGGIWKVVSYRAHNFHNGSDWPETATTDLCFFIRIYGREINGFQASKSTCDADSKHYDEHFKTMFNEREFETTATGGGGDVGRVKIAISEDGQSIVVESWGTQQPGMYWNRKYQRIR